MCGVLFDKSVFMLNFDFSYGYECRGIYVVNLVCGNDLVCEVYFCFVIYLMVDDSEFDDGKVWESIFDDFWLYNVNGR